MKRKRIGLITISLLVVAMFGITGCAQEAQVIEQSKTDISQAQAENAAEGIREQAQLMLNTAETVYVYAYPAMLEKYGDKISEMDIETYFLQYARMIQTDATLVPQDKEIEQAMTEIGLDYENGAFNIESLSAAMSTELSAVPAAMQQMIQEYDGASQGENAYLKKAHEAYWKAQG